MISSSTRYFLYLNVKRKKRKNREKHEISKDKFEWVRRLRMSNAFIMAHNSIILFLRIILELLSQNYYPDDTRKRTHSMQY